MSATTPPVGVSGVGAFEAGASNVDAFEVGTVLVIGAGYVGLTAAVCFAKLGHKVVCVDVDAKKVQLLNDSVPTIREPGLAELLAAGLESGRLRFEIELAPHAARCEFAFLCVPTPLGPDGTTDTEALLAAAADLGAVLRSGAIVVTKSTVPVGGHDAVARAVGRADIEVASNPEFLSEGSAVRDFLSPDRVVIGAHSDQVAQRVASLYDALDAPVVVTEPTTAEVVKYAANAFLATKVSFVNALATVCEAVGADVDDVLAGVGADHRIGSTYLQPGPGWGGSCLPKDTRALVSAARDAGYVFDLLEGAIRANDQQMEWVIEKIARVAGSLTGVEVAVLGLTFKANTDDLRGSPAIEIARRMAARGACIRAYDPAVSPPDLATRADLTTRANEQAAPVAGHPVAGHPVVGHPEELGEISSLVLCDSVADAVRDADVVVVLTEWQEFVGLDWSALAALMNTPRMVDARNLLDPAQMRECGFAYEGLGRPTSRPTGRRASRPTGRRVGHSDTGSPGSAT